MSMFFGSLKCTKMQVILIPSLNLRLVRCRTSKQAGPNWPNPSSPFLLTSSGNNKAPYRSTMLRRTADSLLDTNHFYVFYKVLFSSPESIVECCDLLSLLQSGSRDKKANKNTLLHFPSLSHNFGSAPSMFWFYKRQFYGKQHNTIKGNTMTKQDIIVFKKANRKM